MCFEIHLDDGTEVVIVQDMRDMLGWRDPVIGDGYLPESVQIVGVANLCLCGIDIPATAAKYGRKVVASDRDPWVLLVKPING